VEVTFREVDDNRFVAEVIGPPGANPDRPQSAPSRVARESNIFTGTIKAIDLKLSTITVFGTVKPDKPAAASPGAKSDKPAKTTSAKQKATPAAPNSEPRLFLVLGGCKILRADRQLGMLGNLKVGQPVEVTFREVDDEKFVAELIAPPSPKSAK
jgi:hypothetical protein